MHVRLLTEMAPIHPTSSDESKLPQCYHPSRDFKGDCVWNDICTDICLRQDPYHFIRGKCRGFPGKCFCLSCWLTVVVAVALIMVLPPCNVVWRIIWEKNWPVEIKLLQLYTKHCFFFSSMIIYVSWWMKSGKSRWRHGYDVQIVFPIFHSAKKFKLLPITQIAYFQLIKLCQQ